MIKVRVGAVIARDNKVLLVKHRRRRLSYWAFPGGSVKEGETLTAALRRELVEEASRLMGACAMAFWAGFQLLPHTVGIFGFLTNRVSHFVLGGP